MTDKLKVGDKVVWCGSHDRGRLIGVVSKYEHCGRYGQHYLISWRADGMDITPVTEDGYQNTNGKKWVRKLTPLEELL